MATSLMVRPSALVAIRDEYAAFCFDEAVWTFGVGVEQRLDDVQVGKNAKPEALQAARLQVLKRILRGQSQFREPPGATK